MRSADIFDVVVPALDQLVALAAEHGGLIPSVVGRDTNAMLTELPPEIPGQRRADRALLGCNLIHDEALLATMAAIGTSRNRADYTNAVDAYLQRFATHCAQTATGLFPWGEHSYWHLAEDRVGNSYAVANPQHAFKESAVHDHLRATPLWLWRKLNAIDPACVHRFADGLDGHWTSHEGREEYCRHAFIEVNKPWHQGSRSCDFPRHSGFYIFDLAFALSQRPSEKRVAQIRRLMDYWWAKQNPTNGLLGIESRSPADDKFHDVDAPAQTLSLATSLLEAAALVEPTHRELAATMKQFATRYIDAFFAVPHDLTKHVYYILYSRCDRHDLDRTMPIWGSEYGVWPASYVALTCLCAWRHTKDERLLQWAQAVGRGYRDQPMSGDLHVPAMDVGLGIGLLADLYDVTGDEQWLNAGLALSETAIAAYFEQGKPLPRGASGIDFYDSQMGPSFLLHGLTRVALLAEDGKHCALAADYTSR